MKAMLIADIDFKDNKMAGVKKKCEYIRNAIKNNNIDVNYVYKENNYLLFRNSDEEVLKKRYITTEDKYNLIFDDIKKEKYNFIVIRYILSNIFFINFIKNIKKLNIKIIFEFPTLPYDQEFTNDNLLDVDKYFRLQLRENVDLAITYNDVKDAFGIPNIFIGNGIDVKSKELLEYRPFNEDEINIVGVANVSKWHGYDRVINGINEYIINTKKRNVKFWIIGEGEEIPNLNNLVSKLKLENNVVFCGFKQGEQLRKIYAEADLGIGPLSRSRIGMNDGSALKNREYCSIGLPFIYAGNDPDFNNYKYALNVKDDETPINIVELIKFIKDIKKDSRYIYDMRKYAEEHLQWDNKIRIILDKFSAIK